VIEADLVVHVRDISHPDAGAQKADVLDVLDRLGLDDLRRAHLIEALNKSDLLDGDALAINRNRAQRDPDSVLISAATGAGCDGLLALMDSRLQTGRRVIDVSVALADGAAIAWLYRNGEVLSRRDEDGHAHFKVGLDEADVARFERKVGV
jgi:GTP-binding protein HflX